MLHGFFVGFTRNFPFSKRKQRKREKGSCFAAKSKLTLFYFLFQAVIDFFTSNHGACYIKTRAHAPNGQHHSTPGMPCLVKAFCNEAVAICYENVPYLWEKFSMYLSRYEKA